MLTVIIICCCCCCLSKRQKKQKKSVGICTQYVRYNENLFYDGAAVCVCVGTKTWNAKLLDALSFPFISFSLLLIIDGEESEKQRVHHAVNEYLDEERGEWRSTFMDCIKKDSDASFLHRGV